MNCREVENFLHQQLDCTAVTPSPELERHLSECVRCRELSDAARLLEIGLRARTAPAPSPVLTARIVQQVRTQRHQRFIRNYRIAVAVAAAVALIVLPLFSMALRPAKPLEGRKPKTLAKRKIKPKTPKQALSLRSPVEEAGSAVVALTDRLADETREQANFLWQATVPVEMPPIPEVIEVEPPLDPAAQSLQETGEGVSRGLETVANSARRAVTFFAGEMPTLRPRKTVHQ